MVALLEAERQRILTMRNAVAEWRWNSTHTHDAAFLPRKSRLSSCPCWPAFTSLASASLCRGQSLLETAYFVRRLNLFEEEARVVRLKNRNIWPWLLSAPSRLLRKKNAEMATTLDEARQGAPCEAKRLGLLWPDRVGFDQKPERRILCLC